MVPPPDLSTVVTCFILNRRYSPARWGSLPLAAVVGKEFSRNQVRIAAGRIDDTLCH